MIEKLFFLTVLSTAVRANVVLQNSRTGNSNTYYLYARSFDQARTPTLMPTASELQNNASQNIEHLNANLDTIVVVHGHNEDKESDVNSNIKNAFFDERARAGINVNVIVVDWSTNSKQSYRQASDSVETVGNELGEYLKLLRDQNKTQINTLHLIGFDLGAHVVGFAGRSLDSLAARITGLDPSGSRWGSKTKRLSKFDARYVEVIHTDGSGIGANGIGTAIGDVDFFINGGCNQPGCLAVNHSCNHNRAYQLFAATLVRPEPIIGRFCSSNTQLSLNICNGFPNAVGGDALSKAHGTGNLYRANTKSTFPY